MSEYQLSRPQGSLLRRRFLCQTFFTNSCTCAFARGSYVQTNSVTVRTTALTLWGTGAHAHTMASTVANYDGLTPFEMVVKFVQPSRGPRVKPAAVAAALLIASDQLDRHLACEHCKIPEGGMRSRVAHGIPPPSPNGHRRRGQLPKICPSLSRPRSRRVARPRGSITAWRMRTIGVALSDSGSA